MTNNGSLGKCLGPLAGLAHCHSQVGLVDKGRENIDMFVCSVICQGCHLVVEIDNNEIKRLFVCLV